MNAAVTPAAYAASIIWRARRGLVAKPTCSGTPTAAARPGRSSEITGSRHDKITQHLRKAGLGAIGDLGFVGLEDDPDAPVIITGRRRARKHPPTTARKAANKLASRERTACEHRFSGLGNRQILTKVRMNAKHATALLRALLVLTQAEIAR